MNGNEPTDAQIQSTLRLVDYIEQVVGRELEIVGHKEVMEDKDCPGDSFLGSEGWKKLLTGQSEEPIDWQTRALVAEDQIDRITEIVEE
jgi:N-acetyl-anhydromuramyl-L-alanine amidase AmpD